MILINKLRLLVLIPLLALSGCASLFECDGYYKTVYVQTQSCSAGYSNTGHCRGWTHGQKPVQQCVQTPRYSNNHIQRRKEGVSA